MRVKLILTLVGIGLFLGACHWWETLMGSGEAVPVTVEQVRVDQRTETIVSPASFQSGKKAEVAVTSDSNLDKIFVEEGNPVTKGQPLFSVSEEKILMDLGQARINLRDAEAELERIEYMYRNRDQLLEDEKIDNAKYNELESDVREKGNEIDSIRTKIRTLEADRENLIQRSPIAGVVESIANLPAGSLLTPQKPLVTVVENNPMQASFNLSSEEVVAVSVGMPVIFRLVAVANAQVGGAIKSISNEMDPATGRYEVKCIVANDDGMIKSGMTAEAQIESKQLRTFYSLPQEAIQSDGRNRFVYVVEKGIAKKMPVRVHKFVDGTVELESGVSDGDMIVIKGVDKIHDGSIVDVWGR